jgi:hypothetical protein
VYKRQPHGAISLRVTVGSSQLLQLWNSGLIMGHWFQGR